MNRPTSLFPIAIGQSFSVPGKAVGVIQDTGNGAMFVVLEHYGSTMSQVTARTPGEIVQANERFIGAVFGDYGTAVLVYTSEGS